MRIAITILLIGSENINCILLFQDPFFDRFKGCFSNISCRDIIQFFASVPSQQVAKKLRIH